MLEDQVRDALTFDDLLLMPALSSILPKDVDTSTHLTKNVAMKIPIVSAAMDTVTESRTAICMAQQGGIGIIHRNMSIERQVLEVDKVKKSESGMIVSPITIEPDPRPIEPNPDERPTQWVLRRAPRTLEQDHRGLARAAHAGCAFAPRGPTGLPWPRPAAAHDR